ncbi:MAG: DsbC family protein [Arenicellales bacterium]
MNQTSFIFTSTFIGRSFIAATALLISHVAAADAIDDIRASLVELVGPRAATSEIIESPMKGVFQADLGDRIVYIAKEGKHMILGDVFDTTRRISLSEELKQSKALGVVDDMEESSMIVFAPQGETKRTITVYTDVDCPYCRKLHEEVPALLESGVKVRYLWYPRSGVGTPSYDKAVSIWCADDQVAAMDDAKLNNKIVAATCENPVTAQYASGQKVGVRGTPTIVVDDGTIIGGYLPAKGLLANLGLGVPTIKAGKATLKVN